MDRSIAGTNRRPQLQPRSSDKGPNRGKDGRCSRRELILSRNISFLLIVIMEATERLVRTWMASQRDEEVAEIAQGTPQLSAVRLIQPIATQALAQGNLRC